MRSISKKRDGRAYKPRGAVAIELALVIVVMLFIVAAIVEFGRVFWYADALTKATRDGARLMSKWPAEDISSSGVNAAKNLAVDAANDANVSPFLDPATNVLVECLGPSPSFSVIPCIDGSPPANVRVSVTNFNVTIGTLAPFINLYGTVFGNIPLAPHTTMRYLN